MQMEEKYAGYSGVKNIKQMKGIDQYMTSGILLTQSGRATCLYQSIVLFFPQHS